MIGFREQGHEYFSLDGSDQHWLGVTTIVGAVKNPFYREERAQKSSRRKPTEDKPNKWYGVSPKDIIAAWDGEGERATTLGRWYHDFREKEILSKGIVDGLPIIRPIIQDGVKIAPNQQLTDGIYPEHLVYIPSIGICGQSDIVRVEKSIVGIRDFKTSKEITTRGYESWDGVRKKMLKPLAHLEDCHIIHYALQLSLYMYSILRFNPHMTPGKMYIDHIKFKEAGRDRWDYPITFYDENNEPVVENIIQLEVPYMKAEVQKLIEWMKIPANRQSITKH